MFGWPVGDRLAEPPTHQPCLSGFSLSLAKSSKDNEESQEQSVRSAVRKKQKVARAVSAAAGKHWGDRRPLSSFKITHVAAAPSAGTTSLQFVTFPAIWIIRGGFHIHAGWSLLPVNVIVHAGLRGYFPGVQIWERVSLIRSLALTPFLAPVLPGSLLAPKFPRLRSGPRATRWRAGWNMPFGELLLFQSHFRCGEL